MVGIPLVFNPKSGAQRKDPDIVLAGLDPALRGRIEPLEMTFPFDYSEAIERAEKAGGPLIVWGGDGTIHHAAEALWREGCSVPLAAIPGGSGNGLTGGLRTPASPAGAIDNLLKGREIRMDVGLVDGEPFFNLAGCGFEGDIAHAFDKSGGARGFLSYGKIALRLWRSTEPICLRWDADCVSHPEPKTGIEKLKAAWHGQPEELPKIAWSLCFANLPQYGNSLWIAPKADPTDGAVEWVSLAKPSFFDFVSELPQLFRETGKTRLRNQGRAKRAVVRFDRPVNWQIDGEAALPRDRAEISLEAKVFRMMVIRGCPWGYISSQLTVEN